MLLNVEMKVCVQQKWLVNFVRVCKIECWESQVTRFQNSNFLKCSILLKLIFAKFLILKTYQFFKIFNFQKKKKYNTYSNFLKDTKRVQRPRWHNKKI